MLNMHDAYESHQLLKLTVQLESIAAYDDNLLVGTRQGHLLMYSISTRHADQKHDVQLLRYNKNFSKKPIQQLEVIPEYQLLISLSDNIITVHDMSVINFPAITTMQKTRGATLFTLDTMKHKSLTGLTSLTVRMCVVVKRKLQLFYWKNNNFLELRDDLTVSDVPKSIVWCQETLVIGFKGEYILLTLSGTKDNLILTGKNPEPSITKLGDESFSLGVDSQSLFMNTKAAMVHSHGLNWSETPVAVVYDEPYLIALLAESIEVRCIEPNIFIQALPLAKARLVCRCQQGLLYLASYTHVWCLNAVALSRQIQIVLKDKHFQLALKLTNISDVTDEEKSKNVAQIKTHYAYDLFYKKQFSESMKEFLEIGTEVIEVIRLFPDILPQQSRQTQDMDVNTPKLEDRELEKGLLALIEFLTEVRHKSMGDTKNAISDSNQMNVNNSKSTQQLLQIIDTTLLKCYLQTNDALVAPLLRLNHCHLAESEKTLKKHQKYSELIILYQTKGQHKKALELLQKQAEKTDSMLRGYERTLQYLQHLGKEHIELIFQFSSWVLERNPEEGLKIFTEDIQEIENLPRPKVLDFLLRTHHEQVIPYLEHVIDVWEDGNQILHSALVHEYREKCQRLLAKTATPAEQLQGELTRNKLLVFLEKSTNYTPETVLIHFPYDCLFEERAIILGKLGQHEKALSIYVSVLGDVPRAIKYCDKVYREGVDGSDDVYVMLMKMLIIPPDNWLAGTKSPITAQPDLETALSLLSAYASRIHPVKALMVLPDKVPLSRIKSFLETSLQNKVNERRTTQVLKGLLYAEHLQVQEMRMKYESKSIVITELNVCPVCKKRFGNQSAFARYPNGEIVHYSCHNRT